MLLIRIRQKRFDWDNFAHGQSKRVFFRVVDGMIHSGDRIRFLASQAEHDVTEVGVMTPQQIPVDCLRAGDIICPFRNVMEIHLFEYQLEFKSIMEN